MKRNMEKSLYYISCTGKLCITIKSNVVYKKPELYVVVGIRNFGPDPCFVLTEIT